MKIIMLFAITVTAIWAQAIVTPAWLASSLEKEQIVIVEITPDDGVVAAHIPHAVSTTLAAWRTPVKQHFLVKDAASIEAHMRTLGIHNESHIVLYAHIKTPKEFLKASYIYWAMKHYGLKHVSVLDGGFEAWQAHKLPTATTLKKPRKGTFVAVPSPDDVADYAYVASHIGTVPMIDARPSENYFGTKPSDGVARIGHIQGAMSYFWKNSVDERYQLKSKETLTQYFSHLAPDKKGEVIVYCTGGLETSWNYLVLEGVLGYEKVKLYDASMREWGNRSEAPMRAFVWEMFKK